MARTRFRLFWLLLVGFVPGGGVVAQPPSDTAILKSRNIKLDLEEIEPSRRAGIHSIELYVSRPNSGTWEFATSAKPDATTIPYTLKDDGPFYLTLVTVYTNGVQDPADVTKAPPTERVFIDSVPPVLALAKIERIGSDVVLGWSVDERNPVDDKTTVQWKTTDADESAWKAVPVTAADKRATRFTPGTTKPLQMRVVVEDVAGLKTVKIFELNGSKAADPQPNLVTVPGMDGPIVMPNLTPTAAQVPPGELPPPSGLNPVPPPIGPGGPGVQVPMLNLSEPARPPAPSAPMPAYPMPPGGFSNPPLGLLGMPGVGAMPPQANPNLNTTPIASGSGTLGTGLPSPPSPELPVAKVIKFLRFDVSYQLDAGPSGISQLVLYVSRDDGRTWQKWSEHPGDQKPLQVALDVRGNTQPEGTYGFRLVPISGAGLTEGPPPDGSLPDFRVTVDLAAPMIRMYAPDADPARPGVLVLKWDVRDANPSKDGVALAWGELITGPWKPIGGESAATVVAGAGSDTPVRLPDTGSYAWRLPEKLPPRVYLRMTAWDMAGNRSEVVTPNPVMVDLTKPKAKIQDVRPTQLRP